MTSKGCATGCACGLATAWTNSRPRVSSPTSAFRWTVSPSGVRRRPPPFADSLDYVPDHLLLSLANPGADASSELSLRVDPTLFETLWSIRAGLPRHLINPGELNRLDTFIDRLRNASPAPEPLTQFLIYNAEHVASAAVRLSGDRTRYDEIDRLHPDGQA